MFARCLSAMKDERVEASHFYNKAKVSFSENHSLFIHAISQALYASKIISYAQGFMLMRSAAQEMKWTLDYGSIALMWRGGCIIRSAFLNKIKRAYDQNKKLSSLLLDPFFKSEIVKAENGWREVVKTAVGLKIPTPSLATALAFFDGYTSAKLPANLLQAQRDFFGAHTYERIDRPRGQFFHTNWTGSGGNVSSSSYNV